MSSLPTKFGLVLGGFAIAFFLARVLTGGGREEAAAIEPSQSTALSGVTALFERGDPLLSETGFDGLVAEMQRVDALLASGRFKALLEGGLGADRASPIVQEWAKVDPAGLWAWLQEGGQEQLGSWNVDNQLFPHWFPHDPEAAMAALRDITKFGRSSGLTAVIQLLFGEDANAAASVREHFDELVALGGSQFGSVYFALDREKLEIARAMPASAARDRWIQSMATKFFSDDWKSALTWAETLPDAEKALVGRAFVGGAIGWGKGDKSGEAKLAWAMEWLAEDRNRASLAKHGRLIAAKIAEGDPAAGLEWATAHLDGRALGEAVGGVIGRKVREEPPEAIGLIETLPAGGVRRKAVGDALGAYAKNDTRAAFAWAEQENAEVQPLDHRAWAALGSAIGFYDAEFAREVLGNPDTAPNKSLLRAALGNLVRKEPEQTAEWAQGIGGERGEKLLEIALAAWRREDAKAAEAWQSAR